MRSAKARHEARNDFGDGVGKAGAAASTTRSLNGRSP
jgi:hypothetical protein